MQNIKKRIYKKVNTKQLSPSEMIQYKKRLAYVREYTRAKREWKKRIKAGTLNKNISLTQYRNATRGKENTHLNNSRVKEAIEAISKEENSNERIIITLQNLIREISTIEEKKSSLREFLKRFA